MPRYLVVDDDPAAASGLAQLLREDGHEVTAFTKGADAVQALSRDAFDVVLTDLEMPQVDGQAVVRATRDAHPNACIVVVTARPDEKLHELHGAGVCIVADKPVDYDEITRAVADCRARGGPSEPGRCHMRSRPHGPQVVSLRRK